MTAHGSFSPLGQEALRHAKKFRWPVFPCAPGGEAPLCEGGVEAATLDEKVIREEWTRWPDANIGHPAREHVTLRIEGTAGQRMLTRLEARYGRLPKTTTIQAGERTLMFFDPDGLAIGGGQIGPGVHILGKDDHALLTGTVDATSGDRYRYVVKLAPVPVPPWIPALLPGPATGRPSESTHYKAAPSTDSGSNGDGEVVPITRTDQDDRPYEPGRTVPPDGTFAATVHYVPAIGDALAEFHFAVEGSHGLYLLTRRLKQGRFPGWLNHLWAAAGFKAPGPLEALEGKCVLVESERRWRSGDLIWAGRRFVKLSNYEPSPQAEGAASPDTEPISPKIPADSDGHDARADAMIRKLQSVGATFFHEEDKVKIALPNHDPIPIDPKSLAYARLQHGCVDLGTIEYRGRIVAQRVAIRAAKLAVSRQQLQFSHATVHRVLVPVEGGKLLCITPAGFELVQNGIDGLWITHPNDQPMPWDLTLDPRAGMEKCKELLVDSVPSPSKGARYLTAVAVGIFPLIRALAGAMPVPEIKGSSGDGKTTTVERLLHFHRMGKSKGDYSVPTLQRDGDVGIIALDNLESEDLRTILNRYLLFGATGATWGRVGAKKNSERPIIVVTTIEGVGQKPEMSRRLMSVTLQRDRTQIWEEGEWLAAIDTNRSLMFRGVGEVIRRALARTDKPGRIPNADFVDYTIWLYRLLRAVEEVLASPGIADQALETWSSQMACEESKEDAAGPYPRLIESAIREYDSNVNSPLEIRQEDYAYDGMRGRLFVATPTEWLTALERAAQANRRIVLPARTEGLFVRLKAMQREHGFVLLTAKDDGETLKRSKARRQWGILEVSSDTSDDDHDTR